MKILIILPNDSLGGAEQCLKMIANYFKHEHVSIFFLQSSDTKSWKNLENNSKQYFCSSKSRFWGLLKFIRIIREQKKKYDYIFTSHISINALVGILISLKIIETKKFIARESTSIFIRYNGLKLYLYKLSYFIGYRNMDLLICQTDLMKSQLIENLSKIKQRILVKTIPNPIDFDFLVNERQKANALELNYKFIVSAGRLIDEKGYDLLLNAFSNITWKYRDLKLLILGEGKARYGLEEQIKKLNLTDNVILVGHVNNVYDYFRAAKLCVVSSRIEGFPNVLLQMMSQNETVVSTLCAGDIENIPGLITCSANNVNTLETAIKLGLDKKSQTRNLFDSYLESRSIKNFMNRIKLDVLNK